MFRDAVPEGTFLHTYLHYTSPLETPLAYDFWCGAWLLSTAIGRRAIVARPHAPVFMNLYIVLCADAGVTRKSTAVGRCRALYEAMQYDREYITLTGKTTPESMMEELAEATARGDDAVAAVMISELVIFMGREQYTMGMPGLLTDLYDCPSIREVKKSNGKGYIVRNAYPNFLAASTSSWLVRAINPEVIEGGFTSRCLFVIEEQRKRKVAWPEAMPDDPMPLMCQQLQQLRDDIARWGKGEQYGIPLSDHARRWFINWYDNRISANNEAFITSFEAREDHHVLRLAGLLACNERAYVIHERHLIHATRIIAHHKITAGKLFGNQRDNAKLIQGLDKLRKALHSAGLVGLTTSQLHMKCRGYLVGVELNFALSIMHELDMVQQFITPSRGRPVTIWRATKGILYRTLGEVLNERMQSAM